MPDTVKSNGDDGRSKHILQWLDEHASGPAASDAAPAANEDDQEFAGRLYQLCLRAMQSFYRQQRHKPNSKLRSNLLRECLGRFYLWGEPFGVGGLDKALRQSDELSNSVLERLGHIGELLLRKSPRSISHSKTPHKPLTYWKELESAIEQGKLIVSRDRDEILQDNHAHDEEDDSGEGSSDSGSCDTIEDIDFATTCLSELGPSLMQNLGRAETARDSSSDFTSMTFAVSGPATIYVSLIRERFKKANYKLVERLGEANWQRHKDVREKMEEAQLSPEERTKLAGETSIAYSKFHDSGIGTSVPAQTQYAPSHTSLQSSNIEGEQASLRVPKEPSEVGAGKPFQCFLCRRIVTNVRNRIDWKMHVFADLRPYICTFSDCKVKLGQFINRAAWADHEFSEHRYDRIWSCPECSEKFASVLDWEQHLQEMHQRTFSGPQLHVARNTAYREHPRPVETEECPLCCVVLGKPRREFVKHVARHMEEIALMALPCDTEEDSDDSSVNTEQSSPVSEPANPLASRVVNLPDSNKEVPEKSSTTMSRSENPELLAGETGTEAREEERHDQNDKHSTDDVSNQQELSSEDTQAVRLNQESFVTARSDAAHNRTPKHDQIAKRPPKVRKKAPGHVAAPPPPPPPPPPPRPPPPRFWRCGNCSGSTGMSIRYDTFCLFCGRRKDYSAREY